MKLYTVNLINEHQEEDKFDYLHFKRQPRECSTNNVDSLIVVDFFWKKYIGQLYRSIIKFKN